MAEMTREDMLQVIQQLQGQINAMKAEAGAKLRCKVSDKGGVAVYGLGRWPVTLYRSQWEPLIEFIKSGAVERFIAEHGHELSSKSDKD